MKQETIDKIHSLLMKERKNEPLNSDDLKELGKGLAELNGEEGKEFWELPHMVLAKDDLKACFEGRDDFREKCEKIDHLTDDEMQDLSKQMSSGLMNVWHDTLEGVLGDWC